MPAHKSESPGGAGLNANQRTVIRDSSYRAKRLQTITAQFALAGMEVHETPNGGYVVTRWCLTRHAVDFDSLVAMARDMGIV
ncbi:MAG: hypothetical protein KA740_10155 [Rhodoferax sp.]|jgi:hypothetical protein|nr:hypothetical protein [Rhodoferax sp.]